MADDAAETELPQVEAPSGTIELGGLLPRSAADLRKDLLVGSGLFLFAFALYLLPAVLSRPLDENTELRAALSAREMLRTGDAVTPRIAGEAQLYRPPMQVWLSAGTAQLLSSNDAPSPRVLSRAVQMPPAVFAALTVLLVTLFGCTVFGRAGGAIAGLVQAMSLLVVNYAQQGYGDPVLMFFCAASLCAAAWLAFHPEPSLLCALALGASLGLALLTRLLFPALLVLIPLAIALLAHGLTTRRIVFTLLALVVAATVAVPWFVMLDHREPGGAAQVMSAALEALSPTATQVSALHAGDNRWIYYPLNLLFDLLPFTLILIPAAIIHLQQKESTTEPSALETFGIRCSRFFALAALVGFVLLYIGAQQRVQFMLPLMPALALYSGWLLSAFRAPGGIDEEKLGWSQTILGALAALLLVTAPFWAKGLLAGEEFRGLLLILEQPLTVPVLLALGAGMLLLFLYGARQWVEGRPAAAVAALGIVAYAAFVGWNIYSVPRERRAVPLLAEHGKILDQIAQIGGDVQIYTYEMSDLQANLWLNKPAHPLRDLANEEPGKTGAFAPNRVVLLPVEKTERLTESFGIAATDASPTPTGKLRIIPLPKEQDWPALIGQKQK